MDRNSRLVDILKGVFVKYWDKPAIGDYSSGIRYSHKQLCEKILRNHIIFNRCELNTSHKVAILGRNSSNWAIAYLSVITNGSVVVPILEDFNPIDISHILNHSECYMLICDSSIWNTLKDHDLESVKYVLSLEDFSPLYGVGDIDISSIDSAFSDKYPAGITQDDLVFTAKDDKEMISLNYTSGTTSLTKGVMLSSENLVCNLTYIPYELGRRGVVINKTICVLPMAHAYGLAFGFLGVLFYGAEVIFLGKTPSPNLLLDACKNIRPEILILVPLIFEKIYKYNVAPIFNKPLVKVLHEIGFIDKLIHKLIVSKIVKKLGGNLREVIIGGAAFNAHIERFFAKGGFPFTVGYGMTECAPLISYVNPKDFVLKSVGQILHGDFMKIRIAKANPSDESGEIQVKGSNVMLGYYKDKEATDNTFTEDGWLHTGDKGTIDKDGNIFIKGRYKTMLLGPSGENIYPEAIETKLTSLPLVGECYIAQDDRNRLIAYVYPDYTRMKSKGVERSEMLEVMKKNRLKLNRITANFENVAAIYILEEPLPKTPKNTIKRYGLEKYLSRSYRVE